MLRWNAFNKMKNKANRKWSWKSIYFTSGSWFAVHYIHETYYYRYTLLCVSWLSFVSINEYNFTSLSPSMSSSFSFFLSFSYSFSLISFCKFEQCWILLINSLVTLSVCLFQTLSVCSVSLSHTIHSLL